MKTNRNEILYRNNFIAVEFDHENDWMFVNWRGIVTHHDVVAGCGEMLHCVKERQILDILNDNTHVEGMWSGASKWVGEVWFPALREAGLQHFAWVYSPSMLSRLSTDKTLKHIAKADYIKTFDDIDLAADWLHTFKI
ncbi:hypothetical protein I2I11_10110 [Pontibacter sp. 172403-2]|uniref:hypothetical protein n=1 Tax=Pontibacter rufus TaxID=2791028 RepID=UPI0018AF7D7D|nr:hypothetical protein [Pontibacter sp. 172403-2]MBF9253646.1 hypothetical protein [Pontibacter sp. 172403-2]